VNRFQFLLVIFHVGASVGGSDGAAAGCGIVGAHLALAIGSALRPPNTHQSRTKLPAATQHA